MRIQVLLGAAALTAAVVIGNSPFESRVFAQSGDDVPPAVFQAAGPTAASIQSMLDAFRTAIGGVNNGSGASVVGGRREINWDGAGSTATSIVATPFNGFLNTRGGLFTTPGSGGFAQAPLDGLVSTFNNGSYATLFQAFSPVRLFTPIDSNITISSFFLPGSNGASPATTAAFGAVFSDVDRAGTTVQFYGIPGNLLFSIDVPASRGTATFSFLGVRFNRARVASVRIKTGSVAPGPGETAARDIVMMDDFVYGEPQLIDPSQLGSLVIPTN